MGIRPICKNCWFLLKFWVMRRSKLVPYTKLVVVGLHYASACIRFGHSIHPCHQMVDLLKAIKVSPVTQKPQLRAPIHTIKSSTYTLIIIWVFTIGGISIIVLIKNISGV